MDMRIRNYLTQLYAKYITPDDKQELDRGFAKREFWKKIPSSEPYRVGLSDVRGRLYITRERSCQLLSTGVSDFPEETTFTHVDQVVVEIPYVLVQAAYCTVIVYAMVRFELTAAKFLWFLYISFFSFLYWTNYGMMTAPSHKTTR